LWCVDLHKETVDLHKETRFESGRIPSGFLHSTIEMLNASNTILEFQWRMEEGLKNLLELHSEKSSALNSICTAISIDLFRIKLLHHQLCI
jgi:hypothetical protein